MPGTTHDALAAEQAARNKLPPTGTSDALKQGERGIRDVAVTGVQTCALPIWRPPGETLKEVQGHAFSLEDAGQGAVHGSHRVPRDDPTPPRPQKLNRPPGVGRGEDLCK